jgi:Icc-related predicted phosphoesterase
LAEEITMEFSMIADFHGRYRDFKSLRGHKNALLIVAGDITKNGTIGELYDFNEFVKTLNYRHVIVTPGNTDLGLENPTIVENILSDCICLIDEYVTIEGYKIYGTPWTLPMNGVNKHIAFTGDEVLLINKFSAIPKKLDLLITHSPARGVLDRSLIQGRVGSRALMLAIKEAPPKYHVHGHAHNSSGSYGGYYHDNFQTSHFNACAIGAGGATHRQYLEGITTWCFR